MKEKSLWLDSEEIKEFEQISKDIEVDVLIVGGGIVGILCAYELQRREINYVLLEQDRIGRKTSKDTTAFLTIQHETMYQDVCNLYSLEAAKEYLDLNLKALEKYKELASIYDFDYQNCDSVLFTKSNKDKILKEQKLLEKLNYKTEVIENSADIKDFKIGIKFFNQGTINPYKLIKCLSKNLNIYERSKVEKIKANYAIVNDKYKVKFKKVIIATHYPLINKHGLYFAKLTQRRSYVVALKNETNIKDTYCSIDKDGLYYRTFKDYLIIGGSDRDNKTHCVKSFLNCVSKIIDAKKIEYFWSGQDVISLDGIPYIGKHSRFKDNFYVATGFNLWGFTWAMASSFIIADLIENKKMYYLVSPSRRMNKNNLLKNTFTTLKGILKLKVPRCTHLGSSLIYNELENIYECPCHGSRFSSDGKVIDGPARRNLK